MACGVGGCLEQRYLALEDTTAVSNTATFYRLPLSYLRVCSPDVPLTAPRSVSCTATCPSPRRWPSPSTTVWRRSLERAEWRWVGLSAHLPAALMLTHHNNNIAAVHVLYYDEVINQLQSCFQTIHSLRQAYANAPIPMWWQLGFQNLQRKCFPEETK